MNCTGAKPLSPFKSNEGNLKPTLLSRMTYRIVVKYSSIKGLYIATRKRSTSSENGYKVGKKKLLRRLTRGSYIRNSTFV